ncbi:MAG: adenosylcobinamide-GDP ribazoletransferase [Thermacetogeniaceae bacterium]
MQSFLCALAFLTRIPIPMKKNYNSEIWRNSLYFFPLIGLILGLILEGSWWVLSHLFSSTISAALLLLIHIFLTGGLHLDGLMDTLDGLGGGKTREHILAIMKDSRVGAFGVQGAVVACILKFSFYCQITPRLLPLLAIAPIMGRQSLVFAQVSFPYARSKGLGSFFAAYRDYKKLAITTAVTLILVAVLMKLQGVLLFLLSYVFIFFTAKLINHLLNGLTGDTYGAICETTEIFVLLLGFLMIS